MTVRRVDIACAVVALAFGAALWVYASAQEPQAQPTPAPAQAAPAAPTQPNSFQAVLLENAQLKVLRAQDVMQAALTNWNATCDAVKQANGWHTDAQCDIRSSPVTIKAAAPQQGQSRPKPAPETK